MIPKIIWQTHELPYEELPNFQKNIINTWIYLNPEWDYRYITANERSDMVKEYDILYKCYEVSNKINQADIWRIITTYKYGGVYADMDSVCINPLDDMINKYYNGEDMICTSEGGNILLGPTWEGSVNCSNFGSIKNGNVLKKILDEIIEKCNYMIETKKTYELFSLNGVPVWSSFSDITKANKKSILFKDEYCYHSRRFKNNFDPNYNVLYDGSIINYKTLAESKNWIIY